MDDKLQPVDQLTVPVFITYKSPRGIRADREMFDDAHMVCLRWQDGAGWIHNACVEMPQRWVNDKNYYMPSERRWAYE